jgi:hypothetical protein
METLIINADKENAKLILQLVRKLGGSGKILTEKEKEAKSPYDPIFVRKIKTREKNSQGKKLTRINPDNVWENI